MAHTTRLKPLRQRRSPAQMAKRAKKIDKRAFHALVLSGVRRNKTLRLRKFFTAGS